MARIAASLATLRRQFNSAAPGRSTRSDGWIGDAKHRARKSDHNPNWEGVVTALDVTHDPAGGADMRAVAEAIRLNRPSRLKYAIYDRRKIRSYRWGLIPAWKWAKYRGSNPHITHMHFSVSSRKSKYDDPGGWGIAPAGTVREVYDTETEEETVNTLKRGSRGKAVQIAQSRLRSYGLSKVVGKADGIFGAKTLKAVRAFQKDMGLVQTGTVDGITMTLLLVE